MNTNDKISAIMATQIGEITNKKNIEKACKPRGGEKQNEFISRCIKEQMGKGKTQDEAKGMCYGIWRGEKAKQSIFKSFNMALKRIIKGLNEKRYK